MKLKVRAKYNGTDGLTLLVDQYQNEKTVDVCVPPTYTGALLTGWRVFGGGSTSSSLWRRVGATVVRGTECNDDCVLCQPPQKLINC